MKKEICYIILGRRGKKILRGRLIKKIIGKKTMVKFDGGWVLKREEQKGDILGFWHTHPDGNLSPSIRDRKTMEAWITCFGKPLLCIIQNACHKKAYLVSLLYGKEWKYLWSERPFIYKYLNRFGVS